MSRGLEQFHRDVISGGDRSGTGSLLRGCLSLAEPLYSIVTATRNQMFAAGTIKTHRAARPVISIGNITTGGTGKTPVVRWLAEKLRAAGHTPAILMRGYKSRPGQGSDEQRMLRSLLPGVVVEANPNRCAGAGKVIASNPDVDVLLLDDGFQHRRLHRDFDLVLIDASNPFGFEHVLPRGLLREPIEGLGRAGAFLITHAELVDTSRLAQIESRLHQYNPHAPIHRCMHAQTGVRAMDGSQIQMSGLHGRRLLSFCGIGNPAAFDRQIANGGAVLAGSQWFGDHHHYTRADLIELRNRAIQLNADLLITTEKDWVKIAPLIGLVPGLPPVVRVELSIRFLDQDETKLFELIARCVRGSIRRP